MAYKVVLPKETLIYLVCIRMCICKIPWMEKIEGSAVVEDIGVRLKRRKISYSRVSYTLLLSAGIQGSHPRAKGYGVRSSRLVVR